MGTPISPEAALRIGLAARALPGVGVTQLLQILHERLGSPLDLETLGRITVTDLKTGFASTDGEEDGEDVRDGVEPYKVAVRILWGETLEDESVPTPQPYAEGDMPGSIRVAMASNSGEALDGHFGSCLRFLVYQVGLEEIRLVDVRSAAGADLAEDKNAFRAELIADCPLLMVVSIGGPAAAKVIRQGIFPLKQVAGGEAPALLRELSRTTLRHPPPWLAKILGQPAYTAHHDDDSVVGA